MTINEALSIKRLLEGNYLKVKEMDDTVFSAMLSELNYKTMQETCINYIKTNKFVPNIANLIDAYNDTLAKERQVVIHQMNQAGYFYSTTEYEKALLFAEKNIIPHWFKKMMLDFLGHNKKISNDKKQLLIGGA